jgi:hypothetical protein
MARRQLSSLLTLHTSLLDLAERKLGLFFWPNLKEDRKVDDLRSAINAPTKPLQEKPMGKAHPSGKATQTGLALSGWI